MKNIALLIALLLVSSAHASESISVTLLFTNDVESAYDPIPAFWLDDLDTIGGIAEMTTLIRNIRDKESNVFLFDSGDIFTGALAKLTEGRLAFELMTDHGLRRHGDRKSRVRIRSRDFCLAKKPGCFSRSWR